jgi:hypothetical protein
VVPFAGAFSSAEDGEVDTDDDAALTPRPRSLLLNPTRSSPLPNFPPTKPVSEHDAAELDAKAPILEPQANDSIANNSTPHSPTTHPTNLFSNL